MTQLVPVTSSQKIIFRLQIPMCYWYDQWAQKQHKWAQLTNHSGHSSFRYGHLLLVYPIQRRKPPIRTGQFLGNGCSSGSPAPLAWHCSNRLLQIDCSCWIETNIFALLMHTSMIRYDNVFGCQVFIFPDLNEMIQKGWAAFAHTCFILLPLITDQMNRSNMSLLIASYFDTLDVSRRSNIRGFGEEKTVNSEELNSK